MNYKINEIFYSLQGEGFWVGIPMVFVRFSGCNLKCSYCDTKHEKVNFQFTAEELIKYLEDNFSECKRICLTGGEPMLQVSQNLVNKLYENGYCIHIETNGTIDKILNLCWKTISPKENWKLRRGDELKIIWQGQTIEELNHYTRDVRFDFYYLQPCYPWLTIPPNSPLMVKRLDKLLNIIKGDNLWRLSLQIQKVLNTM